MVRLDRQRRRRRVRRLPGRHQAPRLRGDRHLQRARCGTNYTLGVDAYDAAGNRSCQTVGYHRDDALRRHEAPDRAHGLTASDVTQTGLTLAWSASTDNVGVAGYDVYRNGTKIGSTASPTYALASLTCNTAYTVAWSHTTPPATGRRRPSW